ncbi:hypothetical protein AAC387_Pa01g1389 [Persea americana]|eukprot:TRINITY_DN12768_c0_g2_i2.p1 TRINITY_DN12768_c0_g2~~TRINITY_DN12768_c0_g2_i2.p1  ORF type:complete len:567 (+),score=144.75 TRINITY_DN12768_c0_g2_i2:408-2108(+)
MNLLNKGFLANKDEKFSTLKKSTTLNPNAAEFVPSALRSSSVSTGNTDVTKIDVSGASGKAVFHRSESSVSNNSDDEVHQYWRRQLPDDITPDFKVMGDEVQESGTLSLADLSIHDGLEASRFSALENTTNLRPEASSNGNDPIALSGKMRYSIPTYGEDQSSAALLNFPTSLWDKQFVNGDRHFTNAREGHTYSGDSNSGYFDLLNENTTLDETEINPVEFLATQFPGFAAESLAEVYYASRCDLNLTIDMLIQLELQVDGGFNQNLTPKTLSAPNLSALDFPALGAQDSQNGLTKYAGDDLQRAATPYHSVDKDNLLQFKSSSSGISRGATDFASAVRKIASQDSGQWKYERNSSTPDMSAGTSRSSRVGHPKSLYGDRLESHGASRAAPVWLETGEAVANLYSELREEARDHARVRNAYFEQARQAYLIGNKALAKELSVKGQLHNMQMKAAHGKAKESIYRQRNPIGPELQSYGRGQERLIDLHGLHVSEAIHILKQELSFLRSTARSAVQPLQVLICVGTGHHTKGSRTPARLPIAVERFLLEEGLEYKESQPGLLQVVLY